MHHLFSSIVAPCLTLCLALFLAFQLSAQTDPSISYPYNPDNNADGYVSIPDLQDLLSNYGLNFSPGEINVDGVTLTQYLTALNLLIEANALPEGTVEGQFLSWNGESWEVIEADGTQAVAQGVKIGFSSSGTWTCPPDVTQITVKLWGGAGGGGSSSGWSYYYNGGRCYQYFSNNPGNGGYSANGTSGGFGGMGGFNQQTITVTPGDVYEIVIGAGGSGGVGGCPIGVNGGSDGASGGISSISDPSFLLLEAQGGFGGYMGVVSCGCAGNLVGGQFSTCPGGIDGSAGNNGDVLNYVTSLTTPSLPSYIPVEYLTPSVDCCAQAGGAGGTGCLVSNNLDNNYPQLEVGAGAGANGETGFCILIY